MKSLTGVLLLIAFVFLAGCDEKEVPLKEYQVQGGAQKGPFVLGSSITIVELDGNLDPTGRLFTTTTSDNLGSFSTTVELASSTVEVIAEGFYFDEIRGGLTDAKLTLRAAVDLESNTTVNVNVLTTMTRARILSLAKNGMDFADAKEQAEGELLTAFGATSSSAGFETLNITSNELLLAVSAALQGERSIGDVTLHINQITSEMEASGTVSASSIDKLGKNALIVNVEQVRKNLVDKFASLGVTITVPDFSAALALFLVGENALPVVTSFLPAEATFGDVVTITGSQFNPTIASNEVFFGEVKATITEATATTLKVKVPDQLKVRASKIRVATKGRIAISPTDFLLASPSITSVTPTSFSIGDDISITGNGFNPAPNGDNKVLVNGKAATVLSATKTNLSFRIPNEIYTNRAVEITVKVGEQTAITTGQLTGWVAVANLPGPASMFGRPDYAGFAIGNKGYTGLGQANDFWSFDPATAQWTGIASYPGSRPTSPLSFVINGKAYVGDIQVGFSKYDPAANAWTDVADPTATGTGTVAFSANGKGYILLSEASHNFWEYDPTNDAWTEKLDKPGLLSEAGFVLNGKLYVFSSPTIAKTAELWEYDPATPGWTQKATPGMGNTLNLYSNPTAFSLNNYGYVSTGNFMWRYDAGANSWSTFKNSPVASVKRGFSFVIGTKAYLGSGQFQGSTSQLWEYE